MDNKEVTVAAVRVVNHNDFTISDRFDDVPFTFAPGKAETPSKRAKRDRSAR